MNRKIASLAIPNTLSNITVPLLGVVDTAIAGRLSEGEQAIGAIAIGAAIFNLIYWNCAFLRMGSSGVTAQAFGARRLAECGNILVRSLAISALLAIILLAIQRPLSEICFSLMFGSEQVEAMARSYFNIRIWAAPATISLYALYGWFIGMQNSRTPMLCSFLLNIVNIAVGLWLVFGSGFGIEGIAWATVAAQYSGVLFMGIVVAIGYRPIIKRIEWHRVLMLQPMLSFFNLNKNIFLRNLLLVAVYTFFTSASTSMGDNTLALNAILMHLFTLYSYMSDGMALAAESLVGRYIGAQSMTLLRRAVRSLTLWSACFSLLFVAIYIIGWREILAIFSDSAEIINLASDYIWWIILIPLFGCAPFLLDGILIGATDSKTMRNAMLLSTTTFFVTYFATYSIMGNNALWLSFTTFLIARGGYILLLTRGLRSVYSCVESKIP
ncbi:MAG: MATE family efflux transporter [Rikenellaceae bacterium]